MERKERKRERRRNATTYPFLELSNLNGDLLCRFPVQVGVEKSFLFDELTEEEGQEFLVC